jgi:hypothetical protein
MFFLDSRIKYIFGSLFIVYFMQGFFYAGGGTLSRVVLFLFLIMSGLYSLLALGERPRPVIFWWIWILVGVHIIGSIWSLTQEPIYFNDRSFNVFMYDKNVFLSWLPFFSSFYLARRNIINQHDMKVFAVTALSISIFAYYGNLLGVLEKSGKEEGEITNNIGYYFVSLLPFLILFKKNNFLMYSMLAIIFFFIISSAKRGAILIGGIVVGILILQHILTAKNRKRFLINLFYFLIGFAALVVIVTNVFEGNEYLQKRWEYTLEGDTSGRDTIYSALFYEWVHADSYWNYIFGLGFLSSIEIAGNFAHNDWLEMLTSFGLVGVAILIGLQYSVAKEIKNQFIPSDERWCISMIFSIIFFKMIFSMCVAETFATVTILILLGYILGSSSVEANGKRLRFL